MPLPRVRIYFVWAAISRPLVPKAQKDPDTQNASGVVYEFGVENGEKTWYSQANAIAARWAGDPDRKSGDSLVVPIDLFDSMFVIANGNGGFDVAYINEHLEVNEFERLYTRKDGSIHTNLEIARSGKGTNLWDMQLFRNRRNDAGNARSFGGEKLRSVAARSYEYLLPGYQGTLGEINLPNYDLEYLRV